MHYNRMAGKINITPPSFLIIGAQKAGTTALFHLLIQHPQILSPKVKEINYFQDDSNYAAGQMWYHEHFSPPNSSDKIQISFEATPGYLYHEPVAERIYCYNPSLKLIVLVRNPIERAYSSWNMYKNFNRSSMYSHLTEYRSFETAIGDEIDELISQNHHEYKGYIRQISSAVPFPGYICRGMYYDQISRFTKYFPIDQIKVIHSQDLKTNTMQTLNDITNYLCIDDYKFEIKSISSNTGRYESKCDTHVADILKSIFKKHNEKLYKFTGIDYGWQQ